MTKICYFSGTGNSLWSAKKIAEITAGECELINIGAYAREDKITVAADAVILVFPSYAYGLPIIVGRFIKKAVFNTPYIAAFVTFGSKPGGTLATAARILKRKYKGGVFFGRIPAVENYIAIFGPPKEKTARKRLAMQCEATEQAARAVIERRTNKINTFRPFSAFISSLFQLGVKILYRAYKVTDRCIGCGICEKICPVSAVTMVNRRPQFSGKCEHCNGCLNWCPLKAIRFGRLKPDTPRYRHPEISVNDMAKNN